MSDHAMKLARTILIDCLAEDGDDNDMVASIAKMIDKQYGPVVGALEKAGQFITNGIEFGYIILPDMKIDPATKTPGIVAAALAKLTGTAGK